MPIRFASLLVSPQLCVSISAYFRELLSSKNEEANTDDDDDGGGGHDILYIPESLWGEFQLKVRK